MEVVQIEETGNASRFLVLRRRAELADVAAVVASELGLSTRGRQVIERIAVGESTKIIAMRLGIATNTVEYHLTVIYRRLGVSSRAELQRVLGERTRR